MVKKQSRKPRLTARSQGKVDRTALVLLAKLISTDGSADEVKVAFEALQKVWMARSENRS